MTAAKARTAAEALLVSLEAPLVLAAEPLLLEPDEPEEPEDEPDEPEEEPEEEEPVLEAEAADAVPVDLAIEDDEVVCEATSDLIPLAMVEVVLQFEVAGVE